MKNVIYIKPHHFVDIIADFGTGKTKFEAHPYGHAVHTVSEKILNNRDILLEIVMGADDICKPCKHNISGLCDDIIDTSFRPKAPSSKREWNLLIDQRWCKRLNIKQGDRLTARQLCQKLRDLTSDITDIYYEIPPDMISKKTSNLVKGITGVLQK